MANTRREFVKSAVCAGIGVSAASIQLHAALNQLSKGTNKVQQPNILLLFPDQWRFDWMSSNPKLSIRTPHLDKLVSRGVSFSKAVVAAPVCAPSRACLASGMEYGHQPVTGNEVDYPKGAPTFYSTLRDHGYRTLACGKMDLAKASNSWGIDGKLHINDWGFSDGINNAGKWDQLAGLRKNNGKPCDPYMTYLNKRGLLEEHVADYKARRPLGYKATFPTPLPDDAYCDNWVTANGFQLLEEKQAKPWFLQVNWPGPHDPEDITASMEKTVRGRKMPSGIGQNQYDDNTNQLIRQNYTAMCENIDRQIGELLDWLDKTGQTNNTLILFSSDHGEMLGDHGRWGKSVPYHPSVSVPLVIAGPCIQSGIQSEAIVSSIDLTATVLDYGRVPHEGIDGRSLRPILEGASHIHRRVAYSGLGHWRMAWDGRYKVVTGFDADKEEGPKKRQAVVEPILVFDLLSDPDETTNLANAMPAAAQNLLKNLISEMYPV
jgi:choline-sulfatase